MLLLTALLALAAPPTVHQGFPPPYGATRVDGGGFGTYLGGLRLAPRDQPVRTHDGRVVHHHARVVELPLVRGDLQQCADTAIRLRAEWLRDAGQPVMFHATSGDPIPWDRVQGGETPYAVGNGLAWKAGGGDWDSYLRKVFMWAGSESLQAHDTVPATTPQPGDLLVQGGFPGHVVVLLDVATRGDDTWVLLGEGFMPAQDFHVELGPHGGWWRWSSAMDLPSWSFPEGSLRRFRAP